MTFVYGNEICQLNYYYVFTSNKFCRRRRLFSTEMKSAICAHKTSLLSTEMNFALIKMNFVYKFIIVSFGAP